MTSAGSNRGTGRGDGALRRKRAPSSAGPPRYPIRPEEWNRIARALKAVAHPTRLQILDLLEGGECNVGEIVNTLGTKNAVSSQQLGLMRDRGVLMARREGNHVYYRVANPHLVEVVHCIRRSCRMNKEDP